MNQPNEEPLLVNDSIKESFKDSMDQPTVNTSLEPKYQHTEYISPVVTHQEIVEQIEPEVPVTSAVIQEPLPAKRKSMRRFTVIQVISLVCSLIGLVLIFAMPPLIQSIIVQQAKDQVIMSSANEGLWGHFPGDSNTIITRNYTFFDLINEEEFLLFGKKPQFREVSGYKIKELEDFLNITYLEDGNKVKVRDWTRFEEWPESRNLDEYVNILNMGNLGYWSTLKKARPTLLLQQGLATLFTNMEQSILPTIIGQGISQQFITDRSSAYYGLLAPAGVDAANVQFLWQDPVYGLSDKENVGIWAMAAVNCFKNKAFSFSNQAIILKNYFILTDRQTEYLMRKINGYVRNLNELLIENHYCEGIPLPNCTGRYLSIAQLAESFVTYNTPPVSSIEQTYSICDANSTCQGYYPELYAFYKNVYQPNTTNTDDRNLTFSRETVLKWFEYDRSFEEGKNYSTAQNCLLHIGNLDQLWEWGTAYDDSQGQDWKELYKIMIRFELQSLDHAHVFWEWLKYLAHDFVLQRANNAKLGISTLFSKAFYEQFVYLHDRLQPLLLTQLLRQQLQGQQCHVFFQNSLDQEPGSDIVKNVCHQYVDIHSLEFAQAMYNVCEKKFGKDWQHLANLTGTLVGMENHCDPQGPDEGLGQLMHKNKVMLSTMYGCGSIYCSNFKLAILQWKQSIVTLNVPEPLSKLYAPSTTYAKWDSNFTAFEYWHFQQKFPEAERTKFPIFSTEVLLKKFTFEQWFSSTNILSELVAGVNIYLMKYVRYVCVTIALQGYTTDRTPREILFGYEDQFLKEVKEAYPPFGGDPSAPSIIAFGDPNATEAEATQTLVFKTGKDDYTQVYQNYEINGYRYLVNNVTWFDGNETRWEWRSPWAQKDYFYGTTAKIFAPNQFEANNLSLLVPQIQRYGSNHFHGESYQMQRFGIDVYISYLNKQMGEVSPNNDKYYQTIPNVFNVSSIYGLPLFVTKNHFMNCTDWLERVDIFDENMDIHYQDISKWDDTFIIVEPYTGVSFQSVIYLQNNYYHQPDELYDYPIDTFLPIFSISRSGNLTEEKFHHYYDPLISAFTLKSAILYVGIGLTVLSVLILAFVTYKKRKAAKSQPEQNEKKNSMAGISMQTMEQMDEDILAQDKE